VFYFYTMYRAQANAADPNFFELQRPTLCQWIQQDPPDSAELRKTWRIAPYQDGKPNPFVVDCTLAARCWCPGENPVCLSKVETPEDYAPLHVKIWPNPVADQLLVETESATPARLRLLQLTGQTILQQDLSGGRATLSLRHLPRGLYLLEMAAEGRRAITQKILVSE
jgi:hypothetical protein